MTTSIRHKIAWHLAHLGRKQGRSTFSTGWDSLSVTHPSA